MQQKNYLLGKGERLTEDITVKSGGGPKDPPYSFGEARGRLEFQASIGQEGFDFFDCHLDALSSSVKYRLFYKPLGKTS